MTGEITLSPMTDTAMGDDCEDVVTSSIDADGTGTGTRHGRTRRHQLPLRGVRLRQQLSSMYSSVPPSSEVNS